MPPLLLNLSVRFSISALVPSILQKVANSLAPEPCGIKEHRTNPMPKPQSFHTAAPVLELWMTMVHKLVMNSSGTSASEAEWYTRGLDCTAGPLGSPFGYTENTCKRHCALMGEWMGTYFRLSSSAQIWFIMHTEMNLALFPRSQ